MSFSTRSALKLVTLSAILFFICTWSAPLAIALGSLVPLSFVVFIRWENTGWYSCLLRWISIVIAATPVYIASYGPYWMVYMYVGFGSPIPRSPPPITEHIIRAGYFYAPLSPLLELEPFATPLNWYAGEWATYGLFRRQDL